MTTTGCYKEPSEDPCTAQIVAEGPLTADWRIDWNKVPAIENEEPQGLVIYFNETVQCCESPRLSIKQFGVNWIDGLLLVGWLGGIVLLVMGKKLLERQWR